ncbi:hypothetical protein LPB140_08860 [Sphingorhabdus lutea]|uniref:Bacterial sugar transferase domain-containing protein n=1 Tax=Sphingorhabdus lutea TaxID=1913578 RepID=A0A1L3JCN2_9SPHN|nr:sugar transferase [Sphingorhabdus lutea]APG62880.1 hypothetical protein LPB140_08860 [Sphingorhabdus lutea]
MQTPLGAATVKASLLDRGLTQLILCLIIGVIVPTTIILLMIPKVGFSSDTSLYSFWMSFFSTAFSIAALRKMRGFPGTSDAAFILPTFATLYGIGVIILLALRLPYSNMIISLAFASSVTTRFAIDAIIRRSPKVHYYLIPGGRIETLQKHINIPASYLKDAILPGDPHAIIIADLHFDHDDEWEKMIAKAALSGIAVYHFKQVSEALSGRVRMEHISENSFGSLLPSQPYRHVKRLGDLILCFIAFPIILLPMLIAAIMVKIDSTGPIFFKQKRMGYRGEIFEVVKFRTMRNAEAPSDKTDPRVEAMTKEQDKRITRYGMFLRRSRIDELPQIWNIIKGEMSWIGPRPEAVALSEWYENEIPFYSYRHIVRPGITGWAQVNQGHVTELEDIDTKLQYDFFYIKNFSYWLDAIIFLRTILVMLTGYGSK